MRFVDFVPSDEMPSYPRLGVMAGDNIIEIGESPKGTLLSMLQKGAHLFDEMRGMADAVKAGQPPMLRGHPRRIFPVEEVRLCAPLSRSGALRDFYAFEAHVQAGYANIGRDIPPQWYEMPVFFYQNTAEIYGPESVIPYPAASDALDYELEVACVIGKKGRNIPPQDAADYIFGYMIYNDWSARDIQAQEMRVGLGPAKSKDFANSFGPYVVTADELADKYADRTGVYDLYMVARVNGVERSRGNWRDLHYSFGEMIAHASRDCTLYPGDVLGSGTVGSGCLLELTKGRGPYLRPGDVVELEIERLGVLRNTVGEKTRD
jgi:fumarylacetoacetate (FAA) hydrolase